MNARIELISSLASLLEAMTRLMENAPWIAWALLCAPALAGLANRSPGGAVVGAALGTVAGFVMILAPGAGLLTWLAAWVVATWIGWQKAFRDREEERHRELVAAIRQLKVPERGDQ